MITKFSTWDTDKLENYYDELGANYLDAASDPQTTTEIVVGLREEFIALHDELSKRGERPLIVWPNNRTKLAE